MTVAIESHTLFRHDETAHHARQLAKLEYPVYRVFRAAYDENRESDLTYRLALEAAETISYKYGEYDIPLLDLGDGQMSRAELAATKLKSLVRLPDVIYVSPTSRTIQTLERLQKGWPDLRRVDTRVEPAIRERDLGKAWLYCDIKVYEALYPEEAELKRTRGDYQYTYPSGESIEDVRSRVFDWSVRMASEDEGHVMSIGHRVGILAYRANREGLSERGYMQLERSVELADSGTTVYRRDNTEQGLSLHRFNISAQMLEEQLI